MKRVSASLTSALACAAISLLAGCMPKMSVEQIRAMKPARPAELDQLNMFLGQWTMSGESHSPVITEKLTGAGVSSSQWDCENWVLVQRMEYEVTGLGRATEIQMWTWDSGAKKFRTWAYNTWGLTWSGTAKFDAEAKAWRVTAKGKGPSGHDMVMEGTITLPDPNHMEWTWREWTACKWVSMGEWKGTSTRKL